MWPAGKNKGRQPSGRTLEPTPCPAQDLKLTGVGTAAARKRDAVLAGLQAGLPLLALSGRLRLPDRRPTGSTHILIESKAVGHRSGRMTQTIMWSNETKYVNISGAFGTISTTALETIVPLHQRGQERQERGAGFAQGSESEWSGDGRLRAHTQCVRFAGQATRPESGLACPRDPKKERRTACQGLAGHLSHSRRLISLRSFARAGTSPARRRHALGESDGSLHLARSFEKTHCPWLFNSSNKAPATTPFPSGMVGRFPEAPISSSTRKAGPTTDGSRPHRTTSGLRVLMSQRPSSTSAQCRSGSSSVQHNAWATGHKTL